MLCQETLSSDRTPLIAPLPVRTLTLEKVPSVTSRRTLRLTFTPEAPAAMLEVISAFEDSGAAEVASPWGSPDTALVPPPPPQPARPSTRTAAVTAAPRLRERMALPDTILDEWTPEA